MRHAAIAAVIPAIRVVALRVVAIRVVAIRVVAIRVVGILVVGTMACGSAKPPSPFEVPLDDIGRVAIAGGGERIAKRVGRAVRGELEEGFLVMLEPATCYAIAGMGDGSLSSISLKITAPSGSWVARTETVSPRPIVRFCTKQAGPYRVLASFVGRGEYLIGVYGPKPVSSAAASASAAVPSATNPSIAPSASAASVSRTGTCESMGAAESFSRLVAGAERSCSADTDCIVVKLDCSQLTCAGVNRAHRASYAAPIDCRGYAGPVGNYDCDPQFGIEAPRCRAGCCVSERVEKGH